jgi:hypothetical protein
MKALPSVVTAVGVPALQSPVGGALDTVVLLAEPHMPLAVVTPDELLEEPELVLDPELDVAPELEPVTVPELEPVVPELELVLEPLELNVVPGLGLVLEPELDVVPELEPDELELPPPPCCWPSCCKICWISCTSCWMVCCNCWINC